MQHQLFNSWIEELEQDYSIKINSITKSLVLAYNAGLTPEESIIYV